MSAESRSQVNIENLRFINEHLSAFEWFIFGTLLGPQETVALFTAMMI